MPQDTFGVIIAGPSGPWNQPRGAPEAERHTPDKSRPMELLRLFMLIALTLFLVEGFVLAVFPAQFKEFMSEANPRLLQWTGLVETVLVLGVMAAIVLG